LNKLHISHVTTLTTELFAKTSVRASVRACVRVCVRMMFNDACSLQMAMHRSCRWLTETQCWSVRVFWKHQAQLNTLHNFLRTRWRYA